MNSFSAKSIQRIEEQGIKVVVATAPVGTYTNVPYVITSSKIQFDEFLWDMKSRGVKTVALYQRNSSILRYALLD